jgi:hypothetical protein
MDRCICINQKDDEEKSWQVAQMLRIYEKAADTLVWLGPAADDSDLAMKSIGNVGQEARDHGILDLWSRDPERVMAFFRELIEYGYNRCSPGTGERSTEEYLLRTFCGPSKVTLEDILPPGPVMALLRRA